VTDGEWDHLIEKALRARAAMPPPAGFVQVVLQQVIAEPRRAVMAAAQARLNAVVSTATTLLAVGAALLISVFSEQFVAPLALVQRVAAAVTASADPVPLAIAVALITAAIGLSEATELLD
jgi:hypothetical protein